MRFFTSSNTLFLFCADYLCADYSCRQNCDINAVKALRKFYQRPYFLSNSVSPAHFNWVLMSSHYNTYNYKKVPIFIVKLLRT